MIYLVSGFMRSMTSGMMAALEAGGLQAAYSPQRDAVMNQRFGDADYLPNESYRELDREAYASPEFPGAYDGKLVKCLASGLLRLPPTSDYRLLIMRRPAEDRRISLLAFFGSSVSMEERNETDGFLDACAAIARDRKSFHSVHEFQAVEVVEDPLSHFRLLQEGGWPIDRYKAASIIDRKKLRFSANARAA